MKQRLYSPIITSVILIDCKKVVTGIIPESQRQANIFDPNQKMDLLMQTFDKINREHERMLLRLQVREMKENGS